MLTPFSLLIAMGAILGLAWSAARVPPKDSVRVVDQGLLTLLGALVGARLGYIGINWAYFQTHPGETWQIWLGGLSGLGAGGGFVLAIILTALAMRERLAILADRLVPLGLSLGTSVWLAGWWAGCAYGTQADHLPLPWLALPARDETGAWSLRFPTQLIAALLTLALGAGLERMGRVARFRQSQFSGQTAAFALAGFGAIVFILSYTRVDPAPVWNGLRLDAWGGLSFMVAGILAGLILRLLNLVHRSAEL